VVATSVLVRHSRGSYTVTVEPGILQDLGNLAAQCLPGRRLAMVADEAVYTLYQSGRMGRPTWTGETLTVPPGEQSKSRETWGRLSDEMLARRFGRDSGLVGLGGGVVGDLTGFVAATYMRGVPYVLAPTTLLAMLDASVGGKTGINTSGGKNLIGAIHPPAAVLADPMALLTLPEREYRGGLAEAVKHGLIADAEYFAWMESTVDAILRRDLDTVAQLVRRSVEIKAQVVSDDEYESGRRAILNAGHTVAHALEVASAYQVSHGEAVALGLVAEADLAERMRIAPPGLRTRVAELCRRLGLPGRVTVALDPGSVLEHMAGDKKNRAQRIHCALLSGVGNSYHGTGWTTPVAPADIEPALESIGVSAQGRSPA
jgi:3-dehydroquinate synthase